MRATKVCVVCGALFEAPPSSKKKTCSRDCARTHRAALRTGDHRGWSAEARERKAAEGRPAALNRGTPAAQASPIAGPFETNHEAKIWWLRNLDTGKQYEVRNLALFCREHPDLWEPDRWQLAYDGLRQVQATLVGTRREGSRQRPVSRWKQWTLERAAAPPPTPTE